MFQVHGNCILNPSLLLIYVCRSGIIFSLVTFGVVDDTVDDDVVCHVDHVVSNTVGVVIGQLSFAHPNRKSRPIANTKERDFFMG
jgi:hypothetical protein